MGKFKFTEAPIKGLYIIEPQVFGDHRGYFMETYNYNDFKEAGLDMVLYRIISLHQKKGVLRGLHFKRNILREIS